MWKHLYGREEGALIHAASGGGQVGVACWAAAPRVDGCARCGGLMVAGYMGESLPCWRCLNCGDLVDAQVVANRLAHRRQVGR